MRALVLYMLLMAPAFAGNYTVTVDETLRSMEVEARFDAGVTSLSAASRQAGRYVEDARSCDGAGDLRRRSQTLRATTPVTCVQYTIDLERAARDERRNAALADSNVIVSPSLWLWRPANRRSQVATVLFDNASDVPVSVPWPPVAGREDTYRIPESPRSASAVAAFGKFTRRDIDIDGATLNVAVLEPASGDIDVDGIAEWLRQTSGWVTLAYGRFPNPSPHVVAVPVANRWSRDDAAVYFGRVVRNGGETIELFINHYRPMEEFYEDWMAIHEFSHLMLPYVLRRQRWISEGFAQYYQNVLLARAGMHSEVEAWQKLYAGLERGRASRPELSPNQAANEGVRAATMKIYWSGAALAMMADVELRRRSNNEESLDTVLERLARCCLPSKRRWTGTELFEKLDGLIDEPLFMPLYRRYADTPGFPDTSPLLAELGVDTSGNQVELRDAELANIRRAITGSVAETQQGVAQSRAAAPDRRR